MKEEIQRPGGRSGAAAETDEGGKRTVELHRGRFDAEQATLECVLTKILRPSWYRPVLEYLSVSYRISERRACRVTRLHRGKYRYRSRKNPWTELRMRIREIAQSRMHC